MIRPGLRKVFGNSAWLVAERVVTLALGLTVAIAVARHLGPADFGRLSYLLAFVGLFLPLAAMGLGFVVTRALLERPDRQTDILRTSLVLRTAGGIVTVVGMWVAHRLLVPDDPGERALLLVLSVCSLSQALLTFESWFQAHVVARYSAIARTFAVAVSAIVKVVLVVLEMPLVAFVVASALDFLLVGVAILAAYRAVQPTQTSATFDWGLARSLMRDAKWLVASGVLAAVYLKIDLVMLKQLTSAEEVGAYAVAARLSEAWFFVPTAIAVSFFPSLLAARGTDAHVYKQTLQRLCDGLLLLALTAAVIVSMLAGPVVVLLFGDAYGASAPMLVIHVWGGLFIAMRALLSKWLVVEELYRYSLWTHALGAGTNVMLNFWLIPVYGGSGAAVATLVSYAVASYLVLFLGTETRPMALVMTRSLLLPLGGRLFTSKATPGAGR